MTTEFKKMRRVFDTRNNLTNTRIIDGQFAYSTDTEEIVVNDSSTMKYIQDQYGWVSSGGNTSPITDIDNVLMTDCVAISLSDYSASFTPFYKRIETGDSYSESLVMYGGTDKNYGLSAGGAYYDGSDWKSSGAGTSWRINFDSSNNKYTIDKYVAAAAETITWNNIYEFSENFKAKPSNSFKIVDTSSNVLLDCESGGISFGDNRGSNPIEFHQMTTANHKLKFSSNGVKGFIPGVVKHKLKVFIYDGSSTLTRYITFHKDEV